MFSNVAQTLVTRLGVRRVLAAGLTLDAVALALFTQLPVGGHYFWNLFPAFLISGVGLALSFVPVTIAGLAGVRRADAGIASGLINTSRQVGGAVGLAAVTTIAAVVRLQRRRCHRAGPGGGRGRRPHARASRSGSPSWPAWPCSAP